MQKSLSFFTLALIISGCAGNSPKPAQSVDTVEATKVINLIKEELDLFAKTKPTITPSINQVCSDSTGSTHVGIVPINAILQLKTVHTDTTGGSLSAKIPVSTSGLTVDPGISGNITKLNTQQVTLDLGIDHKKTKAELRSDIEHLQKEISADEKYAKEQLDEATKNKIKEINKEKYSKISSIYKELISMETDTQQQVYSFSYNQNNYKNHQLAEALYRIRESLLAIDHTKQPCLKPEKLKAEIGFQVTKKGSGNLGLSFFVVSISGELSHTDDRTQGLTVIFDLADSSSPLLQPI